MGQSLELLEQHLRNRRILIVEDEASTVVMTQSGLAEVGCRVYVAQDIRRAQKLATRKGIDCALLDVRVGDDPVFSVADILAANSIPFVFATGCNRDSLPARYHDRIILPKPYLFSSVISVLVAAMNPANHPRERERFSGAPNGDDDAQLDGLYRHQNTGPSGRSTGESGEC